MFRTSKCNHGDKGMCINCLVQRQKQQNKQEPSPLSGQSKPACQHPPHMKCIRCLPENVPSPSQCTHPEYEKCSKCQWMLPYSRFKDHLEDLSMACAHKRPCAKCVPPLSRKNYFIDKQCKKHVPYPQGQCDSCMAPTLTVQKQKYSHVRRVVVRTTAVYRVAESGLFGVLLGRVEDDLVIVEDVYFPGEQQRQSHYLSPELLGDHRSIFQYLNLQEVGLLYQSQMLTGFQLMLSSLFQERFLSVQEGHQVSKFITMRLQMAPDPHFQCFMVSDQLQAFHKHSLIYEKQAIQENYFDLITARSDSKSQLPTFLRQGIQTDKLFFKEAIVWIETVSEENYAKQVMQYPFFTVDHQMIQDFRKLVLLEADPLQKYRNIQFLLHLEKLIGAQSMHWFVHNYLPFDPDLFLKEKLSLLQKIEQQKWAYMQNQQIYR